MAITRKQALGGTTASLAFASNNTVGSLLICIFRSSTGATVSDSQGNSWHAAIAQSNVSDRDIELGIWYALNCKSGANTVTVTGSGSFFSAQVIAEYSGVATASALGTTNSAIGSGSGSYNSGTVTSTRSALFIGGVENESANSITDTPSGGLSDVTSAFGNVFLSELIATGSSTNSAKGTLSTSVNWAAGVAIFYPPPNGAGLLLGVG